MRRPRDTGGHYRNVCSSCGAVVSTCRCWSPTKVTRYVDPSECRHCRSKSPAKKSTGGSAVDPPEPEPGAPEAVDNDTTTPIELVEPHRLFDPSSEGLQCVECREHLVWTDTRSAWWCVAESCRWRHKVPVRP